MKKTAYCIIGVLAMLLAACAGRGASGSERRQLTVSIEPLRALLEPLARGRFEVTGVMDRGGDAENFEPSMSRRMAVDASEAFFITGGLPFERALADAAPATVSVVDVSDGSPCTAPTTTAATPMPTARHTPTACPTRTSGPRRATRAA